MLKIWMKKRSKLTLHSKWAIYKWTGGNSNRTSIAALNVEKVDNDPMSSSNLLFLSLVNVNCWGIANYFWNVFFHCDHREQTGFKKLLIWVSEIFIVPMLHLKIFTLTCRDVTSCRSQRFTYAWHLRGVFFIVSMPDLSEEQSLHRLNVLRLTQCKNWTQDLPVWSVLVFWQIQPLPLLYWIWNLRFWNADFFFLSSSPDGLEMQIFIFSTNSNSKNSTPEPENCVNDSYQPEKEENLDLDERIPLQPPMATVVSTIGKL